MVNFRACHHSKAISVYHREQDIIWHSGIAVCGMLSVWQGQMTEQNPQSILKKRSSQKKLKVHFSNIQSSSCTRRVRKVKIHHV